MHFQVLLCLEALSKVQANKEQPRAKDQLFGEDGERVLLQVTGIKLPKDDRRQFLKMYVRICGIFPDDKYYWSCAVYFSFNIILYFCSSLPHCCVPEPRDVCLIVKDLEKGIKVDHEPTVNHFKDMLSEKGIDCVTQVISLRELKVEYKPFEAKRSLSQKFDIFLIDDRIIRMVPKFLGKSFYSKKR